MPTPLKWLFKAFDILIVVGMAVISILVFSNVVLRYGFSSGISAAVELSRVILVWIIFLGAVVGLAKGAHLSVDTLLARLPQKARFACLSVVWLQLSHFARCGTLLCCRRLDYLPGSRGRSGQGCTSQCRHVVGAAASKGTFRLLSCFTRPDALVLLAPCTGQLGTY